MRIMLVRQAYDTNRNRIRSIQQENNSSNSGYNDSTSTKKTILNMRLDCYIIRLYECNHNQNCLTDKIIEESVSAKTRYTIAMIRIHEFCIENCIRLASSRMKITKTQIKMKWWWNERESGENWFFFILELHWHSFNLIQLACGV